MADRPVNILSLCAGGGGLDLGVELAVPGARAVCMVEREAFAVSHLGDAMEAGLLDAAPVWSDLRTFDGSSWRGCVDIVTSGDPCQPNSTAGKRAGADDERWLLDRVLDVWLDSGAPFLLRENVPGNVLGQLSVISERCDAVGARLAAGFFSAGEVGWPHRRKRLFALAYRDSDGQPRGSQLHSQSIGRENPARWRHIDGRHSEAALAGGEGLPESERQPLCGQGRGSEGGATSELCGAPMGDAESDHERAGLRADRSDTQRCGRFDDTDNEMGVSQGDGRREGRTEPSGIEGRFDAAERGGSMANADRSERWPRQPTGIDEVMPRFPPGPSDRAGWAKVPLDLLPAHSLHDRFVIALRDAGFAPDGHPLDWTGMDPETAHALRPSVFQAVAQSTLRGMADGMANRVDRLRMLGNGAHPVQTAYAFLSLLADLQADIRAGRPNEPVVREAAE